MTSKIEFIDAFLTAVKEVFDKMVGLSVSHGGPSVKMGTGAFGDFSAIIPMGGSEISGSLAISFPREVLEVVSKNLLQQEVKEDKELSDVSGELVNIIVGASKNILSDLGYDFDMATPELLFGKSHDVIHTIENQVIAIPFTTEVGDFYVEICFNGSLFQR